jgi:hypothetical protein
MSKRERESSTKRTETKFCEMRKTIVHELI